MSSGKVLTPAFFEKDATEVAAGLVGCSLLAGLCGGIIAETEAYLAEGDPACERFYNARVRNFAATHPPGTMHMHLTYGRYWMLNILTGKQGNVGFVLMRSLKPTHGVEEMGIRRNISGLRNLCNGPGKLTQALALDNSCHGRNLFEILTLRPHARHVETVRTTRVGLSKGKDLEWRYLLKSVP